MPSAVFLSNLRRLAPVALAVGGVLLATVPTSRTRVFDTVGEPSVGLVPLQAAVLDLFSTEDDGGWFGYAPNTGVTFVPSSISCRPGAYWRSGAGAILVVMGVALLSRSWRSRSSLPG